MEPLDEVVRPGPADLRGAMFDLLERKGVLVGVPSRPDYSRPLSLRIAWTLRSFSPPKDSRWLNSVHGNQLSLGAHPDVLLAVLGVEPRQRLALLLAESCSSTLRDIQWFPSVGPRMGCQTTVQGNQAHH